MATFTALLSDLIEDHGFKPFETRPELTYPIFDETYRETLNGKILRHYWNYEIGFETVDQFKFGLNRKMCEIMPYFNQMYKSQIELDPLVNMRITTIGEQNDTTNSSATATSTNTSENDSLSRAVSSETPQTRLSGNEDYATGATDSTGRATTLGEAESGSNEASSRDATMSTTVEGMQGHGADLLAAYRASFLNLDMDVVRALSSLFMGIWSNGDEYSHTEEMVRFGYGLSYGYPTL